MESDPNDNQLKKKFKNLYFTQLKESTLHTTGYILKEILKKNVIKKKILDIPQEQILLQLSDGPAILQSAQNELWPEF